MSLTNVPPALGNAGSSQRLGRLRPTQALKANRPQSIDNPGNESAALLPRGWRTLFWLLPTVGAVFILTAPLWLSPAAWDRVVHDELGVLELMTVAYLLPTVGLLAWLAARKGKNGATRLPDLARVWLALLAVAAFYFMGEEASWGQHVLGFEPPAAVADNNLQGEFNLHNADAWYHDLVNEVPRTLASVACVVGAGLLPLIVRKRRREPGAAGHAGLLLIPTAALVFPAWLAWGWNLPEKFIADTEWAAPGTWSYYALVAAADESKEYFLALTLMLYSLSVFLRYPQWSAAAAVGHEPAGGR